MVTDERVINHLRYLCKTYNTIVKSMAVTSQRLQSIMPDAEITLMPEYKNFKTAKDNISRRIEKELTFWPIWTEWAEKVPGIGPYIAGNIILLYYYRFDPICEKCGDLLIKKEKALVCQGCGKKASGDGLLKHKINYKDFSNISKWW
ncbi:MAG: hypothetical protein C0403_19650, partial [Desulfobacterium sp.]|nr:hypothetical protein [Desulfobacterium sp.]